MKIRRCLNCNEEFECIDRRVRKQKFCSLSCAQTGKFNNAKRKEVRKKLSENHHKKGKTNIEVYGVEKTKELKEKASIRMTGKKMPKWVGKKISRAKREKNGTTDWESWRGYYSFVWSETNKQPIHLLENFNKRGRWGKDVYHLDHIISVKKGYEMGIDYREIGNIKNLRFIPAVENIKKGAK